MTEQTEPILKFFAYEHLPPHLRKVSKEFSWMAYDLVNNLPRCAERTVALRKLLESKDAAVRAALEGGAGGPGVMGGDGFINVNVMGVQMDMLTDEQFARELAARFNRLLGQDTVASQVLARMLGGARVQLPADHGDVWVSRDGETISLLGVLNTLITCRVGDPDWRVVVMIDEETGHTFRFMARRFDLDEEGKRS